MSIRIVEARDRADKEALYDFLYQLWAGEFGRQMQGMDHERRRMFDELDGWATHFLALTEGGDIAGCARSNNLADGHLPPKLAEWLGTGELRGAFPAKQITFTSHLAVAPHKRGHTVASRLVAAVIQHLLRTGVTVDVSYSALNLVHMYYQLGSRPYLPSFRLPGAGVRQPLAYTPRDLEHLQEVGSPTARLVPSELDDDGLTALKLRRVFPEFRDPGFDRVSSAALWARVARTGPDPQVDEIGLLEGFTRPELELIAPHVVRQYFQAGQYIYRRGEREPGMGVVLSGSLGVAVGEDGGHVVAVLGPSQPFGELQALGAGERSADVMALERSEVLLLPPDLVDRVWKTDKDLGFRLARRLLQVLGQRLVSSNGERLAVERSSARPARSPRPAVHAGQPDISELAPVESYAFASFEDHEEEIRRLSMQATVVASLEFPALQAAGLTDGMRVLDLGSGPGVFATTLTRRMPGCEVVGVELEPALREAAQALALRQGVAARCRFEAGAAQNIPLPDDHVDFSYARLLLQHLADPELVVSEMVRVTKPGGVVCILDADDHSIIIHPPVPGWDELQAKLQGVQAEMGGDRHVGRKLHGFLVNGGLQRVLVDVINVSPASIGPEAFYTIGFGFKHVLLERGGFWDEDAKAVFQQLRERVQEPTSFATYSGFVAHGVVPS